MVALRVVLCVSDMERAGFLLRSDYLATIQTLAERDRDAAARRFLDWAVARAGPELQHMNILSTAQKQQLFFAPLKYVTRNGTEVIIPEERVFEVENTDGFIAPGDHKAKKKRCV